MYKPIAKIYDKAGWADYSQTIFQKLKPSLYKWKTSTHLDLACGTGIFCQDMRRIGIASQGLDISPSMIKIARANYPGINFRVANMCNFRDHKRYELITCLYDSINHLSQFSDWKKTFQMAFNHLEAEGFFLFDFNTLNSIKEKTNTFRRKNNDIEIIIKKQNLNPHTCKINVNWQENSKPKSFTILEKSFSFTKIETALKKTGFKKIKILFNKTKEPNKLPRLFVLAQK